MIPPRPPQSTPAAVMRRALIFLLPVGSVIAAAVVVTTMFGPASVIRALHHANLALVAAGFLCGALIEVVKARRDSLMLSRCRHISWAETFGIEAVSKGLGRFLPLGPATMGLGCLLVREIKGIPLMFSAGVFVAAGVLDHVALLPLLGYLLGLVHLPLWERLLVVGVTVETLVVLAVPSLFALAGPRLLCHICAGHAPRFAQRLASGLAHATAGLSALAGSGWRRAVNLLALTLLATGLALIRLELFLHAFGLSADLRQLSLLMVFSTAVNSLPVPVPGAGTWATARALRAAAISGSGAGGYVLILRAVSSIENPVLAAFVLLWWSLPWSPSTIRAADIVRHIRAERAQRAKVPATPGGRSPF